MKDLEIFSLLKDGCYINLIDGYRYIVKSSKMNETDPSSENYVDISDNNF